MTPLEAARKYLECGYSVIPLYHPDHDPAPQGKKGKRPKIAWADYQRRRPTEQELEEWFGNGPTNIGIVTGALSGVNVIDCDSPAAIDVAKKNGIPNCPRVKTGKGYHYYLRNTGKSNFQKRDDLPGIDFRGEGGYVVAPPSVHESGSVYEWEDLDYSMPECPMWIFGDSRTKKPLVELYKGAGLGDRNQTLARLCGVWAKSLSLDEMIQMAEAWNTKNIPPLDQREIVTTCRSIHGKEHRGEASVEEIVYVPQLRDKLRHVYQHGIRRGDRTGWANLDHYYSVRKGEWTLITGIPGSGKTEFLDHLMVNLSTIGWRFGVFSAENLPHERHTISLIEKYLDKPFSEGPTPRATGEDVATALDYLSERFFFVRPDESQLTIERILSVGKVLVEKHGITGLVVDPWNELDHTRPPGMTETEYVSSSLTKVRRFAREQDVHVWVVAHPTKLQKDKEGQYPVPTPYDVSGSAHWRNKADNAISLWRDIMQPKSATQVHIQKIRFREVGKVGMAELHYDVVTGRYKATEEPESDFWNKH